LRQSTEGKGRKERRAQLLVSHRREGEGKTAFPDLCLLILNGPAPNKGGREIRGGTGSTSPTLNFLPRPGEGRGDWGGEPSSPQKKGRPTRKKGKNGCEIGKIFSPPYTFHPKKRLIKPLAGNSEGKRGRRKRRRNHQSLKRCKQGKDFKRKEGV